MSIIATLLTLPLALCAVIPAAPQPANHQIWARAPSGSAAPIASTPAPVASTPPPATSAPPTTTAPPATTTPSSTTTTTTSTPTPSQSLNITVEVGSNTFFVGDYDQQLFLGDMTTPCNAQGCAVDDPTSFQFNWTQSSGYAYPATGTLTMSGNADNNDGYINALLASVNSALMTSSSCTTVDSIYYCNGEVKNKHRRMVDPPVIPCKSAALQQCTVVDYLQATMYDQTGAQVAQVTMNGASKNPNPFTCSNVVSAIQDGLGLLPLPGYVGGIATIVQAFCSL